MRLRGEVTLARVGTEQDRPITLTTPALNVWPKKDYAETDQPVTVVSDGLRLDAVGMKAYIDDQRVEFLSQVRGRYEPS